VGAKLSKMKSVRSKAQLLAQWHVIKFFFNVLLLLFSFPVLQYVHALTKETRLSRLVRPHAATAAETATLVLSLSLRFLFSLVPVSS
jgi:hypothetical protein